MGGHTGSLIEGLPWWNDPMVDPDETYKAVRDGRLDLFCGHCGMMGKSGVWHSASELEYVRRSGVTDRFRCPNCGEYRGQSIREVTSVRG